MNEDSFHPVPDLLFDEEYADVFFEWENGTAIPAHKNIVFKRSAYFKYSMIPPGYGYLTLIHSYFRTFASFEENKEPEKKKRKSETDRTSHTILPMKEYSPGEIR